MNRNRLEKRSFKEKSEPKRTELTIMYVLFKDGIGKVSSAFYPNFKVDNEAVRSLALCIHAFSKMATETDDSEKFHQREELQSLNLKRILAEYFGDNLLKVAMSEGNKCLICCENLAFKARNLNLVG
ncbi:hypothetical protein AVEN_79637-1 [Araneus ventricosus]|uniref:Uncharacterized protein n=1 Tax=Araneus ventricosus TaxID=182803 RepID=A0A4Y2G4D0_ARAVE|nr:hypothetical protein AVEN_79637-1 [Araneus ventricosus]